MSSLGAGQTAAARAEQNSPHSAGRWQLQGGEPTRGTAVWAAGSPGAGGWPDPESLPHCLALPQEKRLSTESGLSENSHLSASTASLGEPEGPLAEVEAPSRQEAEPAAQEEAEEEAYEEVRLVLEAVHLDSSPRTAPALAPSFLPPSSW